MFYWNCSNWEINGLAIMCCATQTALAIAVWPTHKSLTRTGRRAVALLSEGKGDRAWSAHHLWGGFPEA